MIFESVHPNPDGDEALFEDRIILVRAVDEEDAERKAASAGKKAEHEYRNVYGDTVVWAFREVLDVVPIYDSDLAHGSEVYSHLIRSHEVEQLRNRFGKVSNPRSP